MSNLHSELLTFYNTHIRLGEVARKELADFRDASLTRLESGLAALGAKRKTTYPIYKQWKNQGGYAMHTLNQDVDNNYDLDVGLIFYKADLPAGARDARQQMEDAFRETSGQFNKPPKARENAVTIWYSTGQHLDFAIYRSSKDTNGEEVIEHSSGDEWRKRDPDAVTEWFKERVTTLSPSGDYATVPEQQFRRIVRLLKFFTKSRYDWVMPGGMVVTTLAALCYRGHNSRDDLALLNTLEQLHVHLQATTSVYSPLNGSELTAKQERKAEVQTLRDQIATLLPKLRIINSANCTVKDARNAWRQFFNHDFWNAENAAKSEASLCRVASVAPVAAFEFPDTARTFDKPQGFG